MISITAREDMEIRWYEGPSVLSQDFLLDVQKGDVLNITDHRTSGNYKLSINKTKDQMIIGREQLRKIMLIINIDINVSATEKDLAEQREAEEKLIDIREINKEKK